MNADHPAYPTNTTGENFGSRETGLTKREMLAAMMLQAICSNPEWLGGFETRARDALHQADALIAELAK